MYHDNQTVLAKRAARTNSLFPLDLAIAEYDRTRPLIDGTVRPDGIDLKVHPGFIGDFCNKPVYEEYDLAEMSFSWYVTARARGEPVVALPIFPLRMPVFAYIFVRTDSPFYEPKDLIGKKIGTPAYRFTVNLWLRGIFRDHYGLAPEQVSWVTCRKTHDAGYTAPLGINISSVEDRTPAQLLERNEVDAIFVPGLPKSFISGKTLMRRLFKDTQGEMQNYVARTGSLPITHTVVMKQSLSEDQPWIAGSLIQAFVEAQRQSDAFWLADPKHLSMGDAVFFLEQHRAAYGQDSWSHGLARNGPIVETFLRYAHEQGYTARPLSLEDIFPSNTLSQ